MSPPTPPQANAKRYWGEEKNIDSIYSIYLKKICYSYNNDISFTALKQNNTPTQTPPKSHHHHHHYLSSKKHSAKKRSSSKDVSHSTSQLKHHRSMHELSNTHLLATPQKPLVPLQSLQWETRQIKVLQAATLDHALKFILLINSPSSANKSALLNRDNNSVSLDSTTNSTTTTGTTDIDNDDDNEMLEDERNNVAHITHVLFCTYRIYTNPYELMLKIMDYSDLCRIEQYRFVMHYWMDNYPDDFDYIVPDSQDQQQQQQQQNQNGRQQKSLTTSTISDSNNQQLTNTNSITATASHNNSITSYDSSMTNRTAATTDSDISTPNQNLLKSSNSSNIKNSVSMNNIGTGSTRSGGSSIEDDLNRRLSNLSIKTNQTPNDEKSGVNLVNELLRLCRDDYIVNKATKLIDLKCHASILENGSHHHSTSTAHYDSTSKRHNKSSALSSGSGGSGSSSSSNRNSSVLDLDSRYVAQQLTAIDLNNFLNLKPHSLLEGTKSDKRIQSMIKNFNLLSRHVVVTILKSHNPHIVTSHWITIAMNLRKIKNFNSLKAIIAGLTNESIYRLKQIIWGKIDRTSMSNFKLMASIVDDVNNQTVLRQTQLIVEGTAKMSIEDDSFGTIPYLGTFLTDLNMIDARYQSYVLSPKDETSKLKLINFEKCAKQFEILTQVQLLQKNVLASLHAIQRRNNFDEDTTLNRLKLDGFNQNHQMLLAKLAIPQVSRLFENWFYDQNVSSMTDKKCFEISISLEPNNVISR